MTKKRNPNKGLFGWLWMLANTLGWGLYYLVATAAGWLGYQAYNALNDGSGTGWLAGDSAKIYVGLVIFGILWGVLVGLLQWLALRQQVKVVWKHWLVATTLGMLAYGILREILFGLVNTQIDSGTINLYNILITLAASVPLGIAQWLVLRRHLRLSGLWAALEVVRVMVGSHGDRVWDLASADDDPEQGRCDRFSDPIYPILGDGWTDLWRDHAGGFEDHVQPARPAVER